MKFKMYPIAFVFYVCLFPNYHYGQSKKAYFFDLTEMDTVFNFKVNVYKNNKVSSERNQQDGTWLIDKERLNGVDSLILESTFGKSRFNLDAIVDNRIDVYLKQSLIQINLVNSKYQEFIKSTHGSKLGTGYWNVGRHLLVIPSDSIEGLKIESVEIYFKRSVKDYFGNKLKSVKRFGFRVQSHDSLNKTFDNDLFHNKEYYVESKFNGWFKIDLSEFNIYLPNATYLGLGFDFYDYGFEFPIYHTGNKRNSDFIPMLHQTIKDNRGKPISQWWVIEPDLQDYDIEILPIRITTSGPKN